MKECNHVSVEKLLDRYIRIYMHEVDLKCSALQLNFYNLFASTLAYSESILNFVS